MKVAGPPAIATSLARSMGSTRRTGQINESIKIADKSKWSARAQTGTELSTTDTTTEQYWNLVTLTLTTIFK